MAQYNDRNRWYRAAKFNLTEYHWPKKNRYKTYSGTIFKFWHKKSIWLLEFFQVCRSNLKNGHFLSWIVLKIEGNLSTTKHKQSGFWRLYSLLKKAVWIFLWLLFDFSSLVHIYIANLKIEEKYHKRKIVREFKIYGKKLRSNCYLTICLPLYMKKIDKDESNFANGSKSFITLDDICSSFISVRRKFFCSFYWLKRHFYFLFALWFSFFTLNNEIIKRYSYSLEK